MAKRRFYNYDVFDNGKVYSYFRGRFLKGQMTRHGYIQYTLQINGEARRYRAHQLVAMLFIEKPESDEQLVINHKDGNKLNNHVSNLEWCTYKYNNYHARINKLNDVSLSNSQRWEDEAFRKKTSSHISEGLQKTGCSKGENNPRFRYRVTDENGKVYSRTELSQYLKISQSYADLIIRKAANGEVNEKLKEHGITVEDLKGKVNRLSKTADNEKNVA